MNEQKPVNANKHVVVRSELSGGLCPQRMAWEQRYSDDSGVQYAVRYDAIDTHYDGCAKIQIVAVDSADFPITQLDWLIDCLCKIREEVGHNVELRGAHK